MAITVTQKKTPKKMIVTLKVTKDSKLSEKVHNDFFLNPNKKKKEAVVHVFHVKLSRKGQGVRLHSTEI